VAKEDNLKPFSSTYQPVKNGRPKKIYTLIRESGYSKDDAKDMFADIGWLTQKELKELFESDKTPAIMKVLAHAYNKGINKGDYRYVAEIIQQWLGRPKIDQDVHMSGEIRVTLNLDGNNIRPTPTHEISDGNTEQ
jgi:hypothetical protein